MQSGQTKTEHTLLHYMTDTLCKNSKSNLNVFLIRLQLLLVYINIRISVKACQHLKFKFLKVILSLTLISDIANSL